LKSPLSVLTSATPTVVIPIKCTSVKSPQEDVERRDFTINGLLLDPLTNQVLDYVGGQKDLQARSSAASGNPSCASPKTSCACCAPFASPRASDTPLSRDLAAIQKLAAGIHQVSRERVRDELTKMLTEGRAREAFLLLDANCLLREVLPEISAMKGVQQPPQFIPKAMFSCIPCCCCRNCRIPVRRRWLGAHFCTMLVNLRRSRGA